MESQKVEWKRQWRDEFRVDAVGTPVSFRGRYYLRSGSTTLELDGSQLDNFILRRVGKTWDGITIPSAKIADLDTSAFRIFREKAAASERLQRRNLQRQRSAGALDGRRLAFKTPSQYGYSLDTPQKGH